MSKGLPLPVQTDKGKHAMLNLVPFAGGNGLHTASSEPLSPPGGGF